MISRLHPLSSLTLKDFWFCTLYLLPFLPWNCTTKYRVGLVAAWERSTLVNFEASQALDATATRLWAVLACGSLAHSRDPVSRFNNHGSRHDEIRHQNRYAQLHVSCSIIAPTQLRDHRPQFQPQLGPRLDFYTQSSTSSYREIHPMYGGL